MENADFEEEPIEMPILIVCLQCRHGHESMKMFFCSLSMVVDVCLNRFGRDFAW